MYFVSTNCQKGRSRLPRGLRRRSAVGWLLKLRVEFLRAHGYPSVESVVCYQVEVSATGRSLVQWSPTEFGVSKAGIT